MPNTCNTMQPTANPFQIENYYALKHVKSLTLSAFEGGTRLYVPGRATFMASVGNTRAIDE